MDDFARQALREAIPEFFDDEPEAAQAAASSSSWQQPRPAASHAEVALPAYFASADEARQAVARALALGPQAGEELLRLTRELAFAAGVGREELKPLTMALAGEQRKAAARAALQAVLAPPPHLGSPEAIEVALQQARAAGVAQEEIRLARDTWREARKWFLWDQIIGIISDDSEREVQGSGRKQGAAGAGGSGKLSAGTSSAELPAGYLCEEAVTA